MARTLQHPPRPATPSSNGTVAHGPPVVPVARPGSKQRRPSWAIAGVFLVGLAAVASAWAFNSTNQTLLIVVAARDLNPGEVIQAADLRVVEMGTSTGLRAIQEAQQSLILGKAARGPIPEGTVLNTDLFASKDAVIPAGFVVVGASLEPGAAPTADLQAGDRVEMLAVVKAAGGSPGEPTSSVVAAGTVWSVERPSTSGSSSKVWVSVLVPKDAQTTVAQAAADGRLRLSLIGAEG